MVSIQKILPYYNDYHNNRPFSHCVIDNFLDLDLAREIDKEFIPYDSPNWLEYNKAHQVKKVLNDWFYFPKSIYNLFAYLNSQKFVNELGSFVGVELFCDPGLYSGGCHIHQTGGILRPHLDYNVHPKLPLLRKLNLLIYVSQSYKTEHGGFLELWEGKEEPTKVVKSIEPVFNRAVLFDTTQNSWHGISSFICPTQTYRKSLAVYYLTHLPSNIQSRNTSLFY